MFLNLTIPSFIRPFVGMISDKYGVRLISSLGFTLAAVALALLALIQHDDTTSKVMACVLLSFVGKLRPEFHERQFIPTDLLTTNRDGAKYIADPVGGGNTSHCEYRTRGATRYI